MVRRISHTAANIASHLHKRQQHHLKNNCVDYNGAFTKTLPDKSTRRSVYIVCGR